MRADIPVLVARARQAGLRVSLSSNGSIMDAGRARDLLAAGLDSMVLGEPQIFGQLKSAYAVAVEAAPT